MATRNPEAKEQFDYAYRLKADATFHEPLRVAGERADGSTIYEVLPTSYNAGDVVFPEEMTPVQREAAKNGDLDHLIEGKVSRDEALDERAVGEYNTQFETFVPEHEQEAVALKDAGHEVIGKEAVLEANSAGAEAARDHLEEVKSEGLDERPNLSAPSTPDLTTAVNEGETVIPQEDKPKKKSARARRTRRASEQSDQAPAEAAQE